MKDEDAIRWAKWVLMGNDTAPDLPSYHPLKEIHDRIVQAIKQAVNEEKRNQ